MDSLFEFPEATPAAKPTPMQRTRNALASVPTSSIITIAGKTGRDVKYVRLSDSQHVAAVKTIRDLYRARTELADVFALVSPIWGSRNQARQTYGEVIAGLHEKCLRKHPVVGNRIGEDFAVRQLNVLNDLIEALNAAYDDNQGPLFQPVPIPFEDAGR